MSALQQESRRSRALSHCQLFYVSESQQAQIEHLQALIEQHQLPIVF